MYRELTRPYMYMYVRRRVTTTIRCIGLEVARVESSELNLGGVADITTGE